MISQEIVKQIDSGNGRLIISLPPRHGKQIAVSYPVLTTEGWKTHGELCVGDLVFHPTGKPVKVIAVNTPIPCNARVHCSDGSIIDTHMNHLWQLFVKGYREPKILATKDIRNIFTGKKKPRHRYQFQLRGALEFPSKSLPVHPYALGVWLGDGTTGAARISLDKNDKSYIDKIVRCGYEISSEYTHKTTGVLTVNFGGGRNKPGKMTQGLQQLSVFKDKHIPEIYKRSSITQRIELIAGLVDSDGHVEPSTGRVRIVTAKEKLALDIYEIATSLGWYPYVTSVNPALSSSNIQGRKVIYTVGFQPDRPIPSALKRKQITKYAMRRKIGVSKVEKIENGELGNCIQVDSPDGMYLIGKELIPTHNSELTSFWLPIWFLYNNPNKNVILTSYEAEFAAHWGRRVRNEIQGNPGLSSIGISKDSSAADRWNTSHGGSMITAGVGGPITGRGGNLLLVDDPVKNWEQAISKTYQQKTIDWFQSTFWTRREPGSTVIVLMTRWHKRDLVGFLQTDPDHKGKWKDINLPAIAMERDPLNRPLGAALCPERYSAEELTDIKGSIGSFKFSSLYQQSPTEAEGGIIKRDWIHFYKELPDKIETYVISGDLTFKESSTADYTVFQLWGRKGSSHYLIDQIRARMNFTSALKAFRTISAKYPLARRKLIEEAANGAALIDTVKGEVEGVVAIKPTSSKEARLMDCSVLFEAGNVYLPDPSIAPWINDNVEELCGFPNAENDDSVDACSQYLNDSKQNTAAMNRLSRLTTM